MTSRMAPKKLKNELVKLARNPRDAFYLPFTMRMLSSWRIPEMEALLISYSSVNSITPQDVGITESEKPYFPPFEFIKRELIFTAIAGLKYYPSAEALDIITALAADSDPDIKVAAQKTLKALKNNIHI